MRLLVALWMSSLGCAEPSAPRIEPAESPPADGYYRSSATGRDMPYLLQMPVGDPQGIFVYMHGGGGGMEQGMSDRDFEGNFANLKAILRSEGFVYAAPAASGFGPAGGADLRDLAAELQATYGRDLPTYLAGASAGGRAAWFALDDPGQPFDGAVLLCPAVAPDEPLRSPPIPVYVAQGIDDGTVPAAQTDALVASLQERGHAVSYRRMPGRHDAPVSFIDWGDALAHLRGDAR